MTKYLSIKLVSGEQLMGELESDDEYINLINSVEVIQSYTMEVYSIIKLVPFMTWTENELFTFNRKYVIVTSVPTEKLIKYYKQYLDSLTESELNDEYKPTTRH